MNRSYEFGLSTAQHPYDRQFLPTKSHIAKHMNAIWRDKRRPFFGELIKFQAPIYLQEAHYLDEARHSERANHWDTSLSFNRGDGVVRRDQLSVTENQIKAIWRQEIDRARKARGKLTEDQMLKSGEQLARMAGLVQERYAVSQSQAETLVAAFLRKRLS